MQFNVMLIKNVAPRAVAERGGFFRRTDDVGGQADRAGDRSVMSAQLKQLHGATIWILFAGALPRPCLRSSHLYGDSTKIVTLGDFNSAMAQNCICGGDMEMKVRQQKMDEIVGAVHLPRARAERERDLTLGR